MSIDWSKAPEGATAWDSRPHCDPTWMRRNYRPDRGWDYWGISHWIYYGEIPEEQERQMTHRPPQQPWAGEGLPPVGIEIEAMLPGFGSTTYFWQRAKVVHGALPDSPGDVLVFSLETTRPAWADEFRPIRTPEQIAVEEREKACIEWFRGIEEAYGEEVAERCEDILREAEKRKQVKP